MRPDKADGPVGRQRTIAPPALRAAGRRPCPAPGCPVSIPPRFFTCRRHWNALPAALRAGILHSYEAGQTLQTQTAAYQAAAAAATAWLRAHALETAS